MPLAAFTPGPQGLASSGSGYAMQLNAAWGDPATAEAPPGVALAPLVQVQRSAVVHSFAEAEALGEAVAAQLRACGAVWASNTPAA